MTTNDPEIRAAVVALYHAHANLLRALADLTQALPGEAVAAGPYQKMGDALDAETKALRALAALIEAPEMRAELFQLAARVFRGQA